ncbi:hypothetical protein BO71DRAFT_90008 [Aspergillus ellipticus CBS 707.79]|uniref:Uncharacterized protein n=1 Tax=Aspergillus ellipticus CBS 707.79 TaxID=1448320 RepID=A0A319CZH1_9EURO|nr:hypothetical protein BO71DRAFT_90008 [Aspergillus ellipticus CBS 707.79]
MESWLRADSIHYAVVCSSIAAMDGHAFPREHDGCRALPTYPREVSTPPGTDGYSVQAVICRLAYSVPGGRRQKSTPLIHRVVRVARTRAAERQPACRAGLVEASVQRPRDGVLEGELIGSVGCMISRPSPLPVLLSLLLRAVLCSKQDSVLLPM